MDILDSIDNPMINITINDGIAILTLNRPKQYNALSSALLAALHAALDQIKEDENVRVLVIAANGSAFVRGTI